MCSFYVLKPYSASLGDFEVGAAAFGALEVSVCYFRDEVYGFCCGFVQFVLCELPCVAAVSAFEGCFCVCYAEFSVFEVGWFELLEGEFEYV